MRPPRYAEVSFAVFEGAIDRERVKKRVQFGASRGTLSL
jgi:hypothetical protein